MSFYTNPHNHMCQWYPYTELFGPSNVQWCEQIRCHWIAEPINTYSSLAFIIVSIILFTLSYFKENSETKAIPYLTFVIGIGSVLYHMGVNYIFHMLDVAAIYLFLGWITKINLTRLNLISDEKKFYFYGIYVTAFLIIGHIFYLNYLPFQNLLIIAIAGYIYTEYKLFKTSEEKAIPYFLFAAGGSLIIGKIFSLLDQNKILCDPNHSWFQGHAVWHILAAISILLIYLHFYFQLEEDYFDYDHDDDLYELTKSRSISEDRTQEFLLKDLDVQNLEEEPEVEVQLNFDEILEKDEDDPK